MPKRPRPHQLEDVSRTAFIVKLPSEWVFERLRDYGIDGYVELFDKTGLSTGRMFLVQLKATDEPNLNRALAVSLKLDTCEYYRSLDLPVLIVRYHAPTLNLYVKWFHTFDPYYSKKAKKSITFRLSMEDEWQDETTTTLALDVEAFRQIRSPKLTLPVRFTLKLTEPYIHGVSAAQIELEIRKATAGFFGIIRISRTPLTHTHGSIVVENDKTEIILAGGGGFTLHTSKKHPIDVDPSRFPYDVLVGVAIALDNAGHSNIAAQMFSEYAVRSSIITHPEISVTIASCMARSLRITEALRLSDKLAESEDSLLVTLIFMLPAFLQNDSLSDSEREYLQSLMQQCVERAVQDENWENAATAHYNLGNYFNTTGNQRLAFHHYRKAVKYCSKYLEKPYFCRELAEILFESRRYRLAVQFYERAINLGEAGDCHALYADALMFAGRYRESQEAFDTYLASDPNAAPEWWLKAWVLCVICQVLGEQERQTEAAMKLVTFDDKLPPMEYKQRLEEALWHDALSGLAWFNLGVLESQVGNREDAFVPFLIASLSQKNDLEAWCNAIGIGISGEYCSLVPVIFMAAYQLNGEPFIEQLFMFVQSQPEDFPVTDVLNAINELVSQLPQEERPLKVRLLGEGSDFDVLMFRRHAWND